VGVEGLDGGEERGAAVGSIDAVETSPPVVDAGLADGRYSIAGDGACRREGGVVMERVGDGVLIDGERIHASEGVIGEAFAAEGARGREDG